jgi:hypothetical protein
MMQAGLQFSADAIAQAQVTFANNQLQILASKQFQLDLGSEEIQTALKQMGHPGLRFKVTFGDIAPAAAALPSPPAPKAAENEVTERALAHPEVQRFRELFGGEVRTVRNLKEPWNE